MDLKAVLGDSYRDDMTAADIATALADLDYVDRSEATAGMVSKATFDKTASDLAAAKKQLKERMTAEEQATAEREAADKAIQEELKELRRDRAVNQHFARFVKLGYDEELAKSTAAAMVDQDFDTVFKNQQAFLAARDKAMKKEATMASDKRPPAGTSETGMDFAAMAKQAGERGDFAAQAYYLRLSQEQK